MSVVVSVVWLLFCLLVVGVLVVVAVRVLARRRRPDAPAPTVRSLSLPDFTVVDCGSHIHFVPARERGHRLGTTPCPCGPRRTGNRRRSGGHVVYVDHQAGHRARLSADPLR